MNATAHPLQLPDDALALYLQQHIEGFQGPLTSTKFKGGQSNPKEIKKMKTLSRLLAGRDDHGGADQRHPQEL